MAPRRAAARSKSIPPAPVAARPEAADTRWLETLSEPELGLLIGLKELAVTRASNAGHPDLADKVFHLRALRALAFVLLEESKERLRQASSVNDTSMLERLALLNDPDPDHEEDRQDLMPMPNGIHKKRKQMQGAAMERVPRVQRDEKQQERTDSSLRDQSTSQVEANWITEVVP